jgi:hypothetical protein
VLGNQIRDRGNFSGPLMITTAPGLQASMAGLSYSQSMTAWGGSQPYNWAVTSGALPPGLTLTNTGVLSDHYLYRNGGSIQTIPQGNLQNFISLDWNSFYRIP